MASSANFETLVTLLQELFQLDQADLDFGIYRIMNQKRDEVVRFLEKDLLPQVNLENLRRADQTWKVRMIKEEFSRLMFDTEGS